MGETMHTGGAVYVAVNQDVRESKKTLVWTLKHLPVKKLCLLHVHIPISFTPSPSWLDEREREAIQESEVKNAYDSLYKYRDICINNEVTSNEEDVDISMTSNYNVGEGIVELIYQNNIKKLVMGAAADSHYSKGMSITSSKAEYVSQHAPHSCELWFICKGKLIKTKQGSFNKPNKGSQRDDREPETPKEHLVKLEGTPKIVTEELPVQPKNNASRVGSSVSDKPPSVFMCPISMEIMQDPHMAADGFTYEAEAIRTWLKGGKQTSPMTNARLATHHLTPNHALRSMIQDWLQQHPNYTS